jgi:hypothetical protein
MFVMVRCSATVVRMPASFGGEVADDPPALSVAASLVFVRVEGRDVHPAHLELADPGSQVLDVTIEADELRDGVLGHVPRAAP